jgi:hypothetical protein
VLDGVHEEGGPLARIFNGSERVALWGSRFSAAGDSSPPNESELRDLRVSREKRPLRVLLLEGSIK